MTSGLEQIEGSEITCIYKPDFRGYMPAPFSEKPLLAFLFFTGQLRVSIRVASNQIGRRMVDPTYAAGKSGESTFKQWARRAEDEKMC